MELYSNNEKKRDKTELYSKNCRVSICTYINLFTSVFMYKTTKDDTKKLKNLEKKDHLFHLDLNKYVYSGTSTPVP